MNLHSKTITDISNCEQCEYSYYHRSRKYHFGQFQENLYDDMVVNLKCTLDDDVVCDQILYDPSCCPICKSTSKFHCNICNIEKYCNKRCDQIIYNPELNIAYSECCSQVLEMCILGNDIIIGILSHDNIVKFDKDVNIQYQLRTNYEKLILSYI